MEANQILRLLDKAIIGIADAKQLLTDAAWGAASAPQAAQDVPPRAVVTIGTASAQAGKEAVVEVRLTCPEGIAGTWINLRHSPRLEFLSAKSRVKSRAFRVDPGPNHFQALLMFTTDMETGSAVPPEIDSERTGVVILAPNIVILEASYRLPADATPGQRFVVQAGHSGIRGEGRTQALRTRILNWGRGLTDSGFEPEVEFGYVECVA